MKPSLIFVNALGSGLLGAILCLPTYQAQASGVSQLPGAQQQRGIDNDRRRQQKQLQLEALEEKKRRQQEEGFKEPKPLVVVPEEMKAPMEDGNESNADQAPTAPTVRSQPEQTE